MTVLTSARLTLRQPRTSDLAAFHDIMRDPRAMRYWSTLPHATPAVTQVWMTSMLSGGPGCLDLVIERDGHLIGKVGSTRLPDIGYILHPDHWGHGYATEALQTLIPYIWSHTDHPALTADIDPNNAASYRVLTKCGFTQTGTASRTYCLGGKWADSVYLALARPT